MSREVMKMALEALEILTDGYDGTEVGVEIEAITYLRERLAQPEQEPVAWASSLDFDDDDQEIISAKHKGKLGTSNCDIPLYAAPPKTEQEQVECMCGICKLGKREWVSLTDKEVWEAIEDVLEGGGWLDVSRALEAKLKEKNHG